MKYAIVSVSKEGAQLGVRVKAGISGEGTLYERKDGASGKEAVYFTRTLALTADIFSCYDGILFIMASGIAVRAIVRETLCFPSLRTPGRGECLDKRSLGGSGSRSRHHDGDRCP